MNDRIKHHQATSSINRKIANPLPKFWISVILWTKRLKIILR